MKILSLLIHHSLVASAAIFVMGARAETLTYPDLVERLTDLEHLAVLPKSGEQTALASSWDRASSYDAVQDKYINWEANGDSNGIIRTEDGKEVLAEIGGPGCIWRIWSATPKGQHVRIYLDGAATPAVDLSFIGYFNRMNEPFTRPNLVYLTSANGYNNYTPIPFAKSCRIVADSGWGQYYQFTYSRFPAGTVVPTFHLPLAAADLAALDKANEIFDQLGQDPAGGRPGEQTDTTSITLQPGETTVIASLDGPAAITSLKVQSIWPADPEQQRILLRQLTISLTWDNEPSPAVWSPLGDFFGASAGATPFRTLPTGLFEDGTFYNYWYMPFADKAQLEVSNESDDPVTLTWEISHAPLTHPIEELARFHAKWHVNAFFPPRPDRPIDWTILTTQGRGRFVGTQLHVWNPRGGWWGEGDDKFFVDGEKFPSSFGTGSEDYFGYAWSSGKTFVQALHSQAVNEDNHGHVSVNRWHIGDNVPFQTSLDAYIEKYFLDICGTRYDAVAYWYLNVGGNDPYGIVPVSERFSWLEGGASPAYPNEEGVIEGDEIPLEGSFSGPVSIQTGEWWSKNSQLFWTPNDAGLRLEMLFAVEEAGNYLIQTTLTKSHDHGILQFHLDGQKLGQIFDGYAPEIQLEGPIDLGIVYLTAGAHHLAADVIGKNPASTGYFGGIDYLKITSVP